MKFKPSICSSFSISAASAWVLFAGGQPAQAKDFTWDGLGDDNNWSTGNNWTGKDGPQPDGTDALSFESPERPTPYNDFVDATFKGITFNGPFSGSTKVNPFTISGNKITLNGPITDSSTNPDEWYSRNIALAIDLPATSPITASGYNGFEISGSISGAGGIILAGTSDLKLSGANSYTGITTIAAGPGGNDHAITINNHAALGAYGTDQGTLVNNGGALYLQGNTTFDPEPVTISGSGNRGQGALASDLNSNTWTGQITMAADSRIEALASGHTLTIDVGSGDAIRGVYNLAIGGGGSVTVKDPIATGAGSLNKVEGGTLTLTAANTYQGKTTIEAGSLQLGDGGGTGSISTSSVIKILRVANLTINQSDTVTQGTDFSGAAITGTGSFTQAGSGTTILNSTNIYQGSTLVSAGTLLVNNASGSGTGSGTLGVAAGATLGGTGFIAGSTTIAGSHAAGMAGAVGTQTFSSSVTYLPASIFEWDLNPPTADPGDGLGQAGGYDKVTAGGAVTGSSIFTVVLASGDSFADPFWNTNKTWSDIFTKGAGSAALQSIFATFGGGGVASSGLVSGQGLFSFDANTLVWSAQSGADPLLPEPASALAGLLLAAGLLRRTRN